MMPMRTKTTAMGLGLPPTDTTATTRNTGTGGGVDGNWEMRPSGMLVQIRDNSDQNLPPPPTIRVRVKYGSVYHEINISPQASFGELKKMLTGPTGLHHEDQKLLFKNKERDSKAFLDTVGVKNKSKIVLLQDPISQEKRYLEMRRTAKMEKAEKSISDISLEVDKLAGQVSELESVISRGAKVAEKEVINLIELLMNQLLKLDGIIADADVKVKMQRKMQVRRVQKYVETLDLLKIKISMPNSNDNATGIGNQIQIPIQQKSSPIQQQKHKLPIDHGSSSHVEQLHGRPSVGVPIQPKQPLQQQTSRQSSSRPVVVTTEWETFDSMPVPVPLPMPTPPSASTTSTSTTMASVQPRFNWDLL